MLKHKASAHLIHEAVTLSEMDLAYCFYSLLVLHFTVFLFTYFVFSKYIFLSGFCILSFYVTISLIYTLSSPHYISSVLLLSRVANRQDKLLSYHISVSFFVTRLYILSHSLVSSSARARQSWTQCYRSESLSHFFYSCHPIHSRVINKSVTEQTGNILQQQNKATTRENQSKLGAIFSSCRCCL
jgi:hypothetical protein